MKITETTSLETRMKIAEDTNTPVETLVRLSRDKDEWVRWRVAANPNCPVEVLVRLSQDEYWKVLIAVAKNRNTPIEVLVRLSQNEDACIEVAENPKWSEPANQEKIKVLKELLDLEEELGVELF